MNNNKRVGNFKSSEVLLLICITCIVSLFVGSFVTKNLDNKKVSNTSSDKYVDELIENYNYIVDNYYDEIDKEKLVDGALEGMLSVLGDDYSMFLEGNALDYFNIQLDGNYDGIGVRIYKIGDKIVILDVFEGTPAYYAGLNVGDVIVSVDGVEYSDTGILSTYIRNNQKNNFNFVILRNDEELEINVTRSKVIIPSISSKIFEKSNKKIGYIDIDIFAQATSAQFRNALNELENENIDSLIIDVRDNSGGHLTTAISIISEFLDSSHIIYQTDTKGDIKKYYSVGKVDKKYPIVILQNEYSASASELLSITLKEEYGATIVGENSYGKGTVQEIVENGNTEYKFTTKKWLSPKGNWINEVGVIPDIEVKLNDSYYNDPIEDNDNQLSEAINYLIG